MTKKNLMDLAVVAATCVENEPTQVTCQQWGTDDMLQLMDQKRETDDTGHVLVFSLFGSLDNLHQHYLELHLNCPHIY